MGDFTGWGEGKAGMMLRTRWGGVLLANGGASLERRLSPWGGGHMHREQGNPWSLMQLRDVKAALDFRSVNTLLKTPGPQFSLKRDREKLTHRDG